MFGGVFSWSNVLYERVYPGGDLLIQFVGRDAYKQFWNFSKDEKENLATQLAIELPALRGKVGASQEEIASAVGISRQTYSAYENRTRPIPWSLYLALLFYFDYIPSTHYMIRQLELFPNERREMLVSASAPHQSHHIIRHAGYASWDKQFFSDAPDTASV